MSDVIKENAIEERTSLLGSARALLASEREAAGLVDGGSTNYNKMICPRPLFLESGNDDDLFERSGFEKVAAEVSGTYRELGIGERCHVRVHAGGHEYDPDGEAQRFLLKFVHQPRREVEG